MTKRWRHHPSHLSDAQAALIVLKDATCRTVTADPHVIVVAHTRIKMQRLLQTLQAIAGHLSPSTMLTPSAWVMCAQATLHAMEPKRSHQRATWVAIASSLLPIVGGDERKIHRELQSCS